MPGFLLGVRSAATVEEAGARRRPAFMGGRAVVGSAAVAACGL